LKLCLAALATFSRPAWSGTWGTGFRIQHTRES
jgi:hypothetical protein